MGARKPTEGFIDGRSGEAGQGCELLRVELDLLGARVLDKRCYNEEDLACALGCEGEDVVYARGYWKTDGEQAKDRLDTTLP